MILGLMLTVILLPFLGGILLNLIKFKEKKQKQIYIFSATVMTIALV